MARKKHIEKAELPTDVAAITAKAGKKLTITDIARLANVSKKTVSRVINDSTFVHDKTRVRVAELMKRVGYVPDPQARALAFRRSFLVGLIYDNPNASYVINIQEGALAALRRMGYELVVHPCDRKGREFRDEIRQLVARLKLDGVILLPPVSEIQELADLLNEIQCPYMRVISAALDEPENLVLSHDKQAAGAVAEHLVQLGHERIAMIMGPSSYRSSSERLTGFREALLKRGAKLPAKYVVEGAYTFDSGVECADKLLERTPRPTAIFAGNDETAAGVYRAAYMRGLRIPDDLTVIGFDDSPLASRLCPALTTMRQPIREMGGMAAERLVAKIARSELLDPSIVTPNLIIRESSAKPRE
jgi:LacI family transcriptional regulator